MQAADLNAVGLVAVGRLAAIFAAAAVAVALAAGLNVANVARLAALHIA
jgi:hypothetical protein